LTAVPDLLACPVPDHLLPFTSFPETKSSFQSRIHSGSLFLSTDGSVLVSVQAKEQKADVEVWVGNFNKAREILEEISSINRQLLKEKRLFPED
jgi:hypothetical protein